MKRKALWAAVPYTVPVMLGYLFLGAAFGVLTAENGFSVLWAFLMSTFIYAGSMQFAAISLMTSAFSPVSAFLLTLMVNARHLFYGLYQIAIIVGTLRQLSASSHLWQTQSHFNKESAEDHSDAKILRQLSQRQTSAAEYYDDNKFLHVV